MKSIFPTPEQMDAHERAQWAAWHEQHRQPAPEQDTCPAQEQAEIDGLHAERFAKRACAVLAVVTALVIAAGQLPAWTKEPAPAGPHLKLDLKIAGVPQ